MFRGTTPIHTFYVEIDTSIIKEVKITYSQKDEEVLVKRTEDCTIEDGQISTKLSQEDTFRFEPNTVVFIQLRVLTTGDDVLISELIKASVGKCLDDEVLS